MKQNCYNALDICVELSLFMKKGGGQISARIVCAVSRSWYAQEWWSCLSFEEKGGVSKICKESLHYLSELVCARWGGGER